MKKHVSYIFLSGIALSLFACRGECFRCEKAGEQTLNYCENDFPDHASFKDQLTGLDSAGYACNPK